MYVVIMAGGSGTRLWPKSRVSKPKQFHSLTSKHSLLQETVNRLAPVTHAEDMYIIAGKSHLDSIRQQVAEIPKDNVVSEPVGRNTAPAVAVMAALIHKRDPNAIMVVLPADHYITKNDEFRRLVVKSVDIAARHPVALTLGIKPSYPETGYGYIEMGDRFDDDNEAHWVRSFKEKPDVQTAQDYVTSWRFLWNSGMFVWSTRTILDLFERFAPEMYAGAMRYAEAHGTPEEETVLNEVYKGFESISVDYAILEKAEKVLVLPAEVGWNDVGSWAALHDVLCTDQALCTGDHGNVVIGQHIGYDTYNCLILGDDRLIATIGLDNIVVVDAGDVVMVCPKGRSQDVKHLIDKLRKEGMSQYL